MPTTPPAVNAQIVRRDLTPDLLAKYLQTPAIAVDTETMGLNPLRDRLCLVQLCDRAGDATLVQIPAAGQNCQSAPHLKQLFEAPQVLKVFHFARFDLATLRHHLGIEVAPIYCTRTASKLARTYTDRHGLKDLALELLDIDLDKTARHSDWSSTELTAEQVRYAANDVTLLLPIMDWLETMLLREGRQELAQACFATIPTLAQLDLLGYQDVFSH